MKLNLFLKPQKRAEELADYLGRYISYFLFLNLDFGVFFLCSFRILRVVSSMDENVPDRDQRRPAPHRYPTRGACNDAGAHAVVSGVRPVDPEVQRSKSPGGSGTADRLSSGTATEVDRPDDDDNGFGFFDGNTDGTPAIPLGVPSVPSAPVPSVVPTDSSALQMIAEVLSRMQANDRSKGTFDREQRQDRVAKYLSKMESGESIFVVIARFERIICQKSIDKFDWIPLFEKVLKGKWMHLYSTIEKLCDDH